MSEKIVIVNVNRGKPIDSNELEAKIFAKYPTEYRAAATMNADEVVAAAGDAQVILFTAAKFTNELFDRLPNLRLMVRYGMGYDTVDLAAARAHGVDVCNAPSYGATAVAEHAFSLLMAVNRRIPSYDTAIRDGRWGQHADYLPMQMRGKTLGILGFGRIARNVAQYGQGFGMKVMAYDPFLPAEAMEKVGVQKAELDEVLSQADFLSVNAPLTDSTYHMLNAEAFAKMKPEAVLVNTSRGALIDEDALYDALATHRIRAAGIDVYENYPKEVGNRFHKLDNVILTPHVAWDTVESAVALKEEVAAEVERFLRGEPNLNIVNR